MQTSSPLFRAFIAVMAIYSCGVLAYNYFYLKKNNAYSFWRWLNFLFLLLSFICIYLILPGNYLRSFYIIAATALIFLSELGLNYVSEQLNFLKTLLSFFGIALGIFAVNFYFLPKNFLILLLFALITYLISRSSLDYIPQSNSRKNFFAVLLAFAMLEAGWSLTLLPFHFTALAVILFNVFYALWIIVYYYLYNNLSPKKVYFHLLFSGLLVFLIFLSTPWK
jgi:hypothetical protein